MVKKIKIILTLLILISLTGIAAAETKTINYDYSEFSETLVTNAVNVAGSNKEAINTFFISDITQFSNLHSIIIGSKGTPTAGYSAKSYAETGFIAKIGGVQVGSGTYSWNRHLINGISQGSTVAIVFDNFNGNAFTGSQSLRLTLDDSDVILYTPYEGLYDNPHTMTITPAGAYIAVGTKTYAYNKWFYTFAASKIAIYNKAEFHQQLTYETYPNNNDIRLDFYKNGISNKVIVNGSNGLTYIYSDKADDIHQTIHNNPYIDVTVFNSMKPTNPPWINRIPETSTPGPVYDSIIHMSVYDAVTRNLINGHNVTLQYDDNSPIFTTWDGPISHTSIDWFNGQAANVTYSAEGYDPSPTHRYVMSVVDLSGQWLKAGESRTGNVYLNPIAPPSNVTAYAIFDVLEDMPNGNTFYSSGAAVTIGNTTLITAGQGSCSFELSPGNYQYIVKKVGYQTVSGSFVLGASNKYITVNLPKVQTAPTAPQPTGTAGVDYPYKEVNAREQAESSMGIIFDALPGFASLAVIVLVVSFVGWMTPKKRR